MITSHKFTTILSIYLIISLTCSCSNTKNENDTGLDEYQDDTQNDRIVDKIPEPIAESELDFIEIEDETVDYDVPDQSEEAPSSGVIKGQITFRGTPPEKGSVLVVIYWSFPPMGPPAGSDGYFEPGNDGDTISYEIDVVTFGTYQYAAVLWLDPDDPNMMTRYHDISTEDPDHPTQVTVNEDTPEVILNFTADWSRL